MSRVAITLDEHALAELGRRAAAAKEPMARTAARLVRDGLLSSDARDMREGEKEREREPAAGARTTASTDAPPWIEPASERERFRRELWSAVCALYERYPRTFGALAAEWWQDRALVELLGALSTWRAQLDGGEDVDPRQELLFHDRLELLERRLTQAGDPTAERFAGGPPPSEWVG